MMHNGKRMLAHEVMIGNSWQMTPVRTQRRDLIEVMTVSYASLYGMSFSLQIAARDSYSGWAFSIPSTVQTFTWTLPIGVSTSSILRSCGP